MRWLVPLLVLLLLLAAPLLLSGFRLNLLGKFVTFAIAELALHGAEDTHGRAVPLHCGL